MYNGSNTLASGGILVTSWSLLGVFAPGLVSLVALVRRQRIWLFLASAWSLPISYYLMGSPRLVWYLVGLALVTLQLFVAARLRVAWLAWVLVGFALLASAGVML